MAIGTIMVTSKIKEVSVKKKEKATPMQEPAKKPVSYAAGAVRLKILLVAPSYLEAEDFLCGVYFDLLQMSAGSEISAYTGEYMTITRISELKQELEEKMQFPIGKEIQREANPENGMKECTLTLGQSGNQKLSMDLVFQCITYDDADTGNADVVFVLVNQTEDSTEHLKLKNKFAGKEIYWVISNFEKMDVQQLADEKKPFEYKLRRKMTEDLKLTDVKNAGIAFAQIYGGLQFVKREKKEILYCTYRACREYIPVGCHVPVICAIRNKLRSIELNSDLENLKRMLENSFEDWYSVIDGWCEYYVGKKEDETE